MKTLLLFSKQNKSLFIFICFLCIAVTSTYGQCIGPVGDCDGDNVMDSADLDDDNDGILDANDTYHLR